MSDRKGCHQTINIITVNQVTFHQEELNQIPLAIMEKRDLCIAHSWESVPNPRFLWSGPPPPPPYFA